MGCREYPRETLEFIPVELYFDGEPVNDFSNMSVTVRHNYERPDTDWESLIQIDEEWGFMLNGDALGPGTFTVWIKVTDSPEVPVVKIGNLKVT